MSWIPDHSVLSCMLCDNKFTLFLRKHHCRICGYCICNNCSGHKIDNKEIDRIREIRENDENRKDRFEIEKNEHEHHHHTHEEKVRICNSCYKYNDMILPPIFSNINSNNNVLYKTKSICPNCILQKKFDLIEATVIKKDNSVYLTLNCDLHGLMSTLYCSNFDFFKSLYTKVPILDIDNKHNSRPFVIEIDIFDGKWMDDIDLTKYVKTLKAKGDFILKVNGGLCNDLTILNNKVSLIVDLTPGPILLDLSNDRMQALFSIPESILLKGKVYPCVRYFIASPDPNMPEEIIQYEVVNELSALFACLRTITDMQVLLYVIVDKPYPKLDNLFEFIFSQQGLLRFVIFRSERSPRKIVESLRSNEKEFNVDPIELLEHISRSTNNKISLSDFMPTSYCSSMEPFIKSLGYGDYNVRIPPFNGFGVVMMNNDHYDNLPLSRLIDLHTLQKDMRPYLHHVEGASLSTMQAIRKTINKSAIQNVNFSGHVKPLNFVPFKIPSILSYVDSSNRDAMFESMKNMQVIVVHNSMDFASIDATRANCAVRKVDSPAKDFTAVSNQFKTCAGCI